MEDCKAEDLDTLVADFVGAYKRLHSEYSHILRTVKNAKSSSSRSRSRQTPLENGSQCLVIAKPLTPQDEVQTHSSPDFMPAPRIPQMLSKPLTPRICFKEPDFDDLREGYATIGNGDAAYHGHSRPFKKVTTREFVEINTVSSYARMGSGIHVQKSDLLSDHGTFRSSVCGTANSEDIDSSSGGGLVIMHPLGSVTRRSIKRKSTDEKHQSVSSESMSFDEYDPAQYRSRVLNKLIEEAESAQLMHATMFKDARNHQRRFAEWRQKTTRDDFIISMLDPVVCFIIALNVILTGISLDQEEWEGWYFIDFVFALIYAFELLIKLVLLGWRDMYLGSMWAWNSFDTVIVVLAVLELFVKVTGSVTLLRVARLGRLARLLRIMRIPAFKELVMLLRGMVGGMRTLFWCLSALLLPVFIVGMIVSQVLKDFHQDGLFSSVPIAMFTTVRCMCGDCTDEFGRPLIVIVARERGWHYALFYSLFILISIFGIFNLITAIFLEGTMQAAKSDTSLQREIRNQSDKKFARNIKLLVFFFWQAFNERSAKGLTRKTTHLDIRGFDRFNIKDALDLEIDEDFYEEIVHLPYVRDILDDMGLVDDDIVDLFEMLDVDRSGTLDMAELVNGLNKLRGDASKRDLVALAYMIYSVQDSIKGLTTSVQRLSSPTGFRQIS